MQRRSILAGAATLLGMNVRAADAGRDLGGPRSAYGDRASFEQGATRFFNPSATPGTGASRTPLQDSVGIITPSSLHFERHHSGVPTIDSSKHQLLVHGLVKQPLVFSMEELRRMPSISRIHFVECAGNSGHEHAGNPGETALKSHGLASCSEWTCVLLADLLRPAGVDTSALWLIAEGADPSRHSRSIPLDKAMDDVLVAYGQNGEALRPEQGYPLRLLVPGWEGNANVKWLHRIQLSTSPAMSRDEAASYTDFMPDGRAWQFSFAMDVKSVITRPSGGMRLSRAGLHEITGLAWSGRGRVSRVAVSCDGGSTWQHAVPADLVLPKAFTRFTLPWRWNGKEAWILSRATDESGDTQPTREQIVSVRGLQSGPDGFNHYNGIKAWHVSRDGEVTHV